MESLSMRPQQPRATALTDVLDLTGAIAHGDLAGLTVTGVTLDSRDVQPGDLYIGMPGANLHGATFAASAAERGAMAMLTDREGVGHATPGLPVLEVRDHPRRLLGAIAAEIYGPLDDVLTFGVTGTNGKTSVVYMLAALLEAAGRTVGISTTAERRIGADVIESRLTSPEVSELRALLARMREAAVDAVALEVSAQALVRHRLDGVRFNVVAFNNFSQDHLDEFDSMEEYFAAKQRLFTPEYAERGVVVVDSPAGVQMVRESGIPVTRLATQFGHDADWHLAVTRATLDGTHFVLQGPDDVYFRGSVPQFGGFMAENAALALIMLHEAGVSVSEVAAGLDRGHIPVYLPGRLEEITNGGPGPRFFVDYGHTPGAFRAMLDSLGEVVEGNVIFLFGADGDRDPSKRAEMGAIAATGAAHVVLCDYNPRFEDPDAIRAQLRDGAERSGGFGRIHEVPDPREAIRTAIALAQPGDVILYAGPGHETTQEVAGTHVPYSARDEVREALREAGLLT